VIRLDSQVLANQDRSLVTGFTGGQQTDNANTFTTSVSVHF